MNPTLLQRVVPLVVIGLLIVAGAVWFFGTGTETKTVTAYFPRTVSLYEGSDVRVLGVPVGKVEEVNPEGTQVEVVMHYDEEVEIPADAQAVIVSPSVVGDRYVQLTPAYEDGAVLEDNTVLEADRTAIPLELDEIYGSLDELTVALGPNGANSEGALTDLLEQTARNFGGQGATFKQTIEDFGDLSTTLENNKEELFSSAERLQAFIETLADNDTTVRRFNQSLGNVSELLSAESDELTAALANLGVALDVVGDFVQENRASLGRNIRGLNRVAKVLVRHREDLNMILRAGPLALNNLGLGYNPQAGTLDSNANIGNLFEQDPKELLCALVSANDPNSTICDLINNLPLPRSAPFGPGTGSRTDDTYDPTLNGLVEASR
ncbi:MCE family protein [Nocardioides bizhenqiangii]|uniref:MCE family protein n=1 Tax=Nocardioides bizhenqiangii TaxID=3095076 RepID=A0ABZ0ZT23_9ACTN|nr:MULTISPECIES: MCE family protein [unclassified Nocardioides]MDZ5622806.1 MCE family protein [Nocardioides sp. HM23]WQQ27066.1 MCE family protein [Nocardioides sp. HM61]